MDLHSDCKFVLPSQLLFLSGHCPWGYLGEEVTCVKFQFLANSENSSLVKHNALSVIRVRGIPVLLNMVLKAVMTEAIVKEGRRHSNSK